MVSSEHGNDFNCEVHSNLESLLLHLPEKYLVLIDIPIGLPKKESRLCDRLAREKLGPRRSSVFTVPCRDAVYAKNYKEACQTNHRFLEKKNLDPSLEHLSQNPGSRSTSSKTS